VLISSRPDDGLMVEGNYFRGAQGRGGEIDFLPVGASKTKARSLQAVVSLAALYARLARIEDVPAAAPVERAATSADGPAVGAALLPFMDQLLPSREALMKTRQG